MEHRPHNFALVRTGGSAPKGKKLGLSFIMLCVLALVTTAHAASGDARGAILDAGNGLENCLEADGRSTPLYARVSATPASLDNPSPDRWDDGGSSCARSWQEFRTVNRNQYLDSGTSTYLCAFATGASSLVVRALGTLPSAVAASVGALYCSWQSDNRDYIIVEVEQVRDCERSWDGQRLRCNTHCFAWRDR
jgi:hypothetical protein